MAIQNKSLFLIEPTFTIDSYYSSYTYTSAKAAVIPVDNIYIVTSVYDIITEGINQGVDTVKSSITYSLGANLENLILTGSSKINGAGNSLNNVITGNATNNSLDGGAGDDKLYGMAGNDDLIGGLGNDLLDGGVGADKMSGGLGDDTYIVDNLGDLVIESLNEGIDTVQSSITYKLGSNLENLTLTGKLAINGNGNSLNNIIIGNAANNKIDGGLGNDTIDAGQGNNFVEGGAGDDTIIGGLGYYNYYYGGSGIDTVDYSRNTGALAILLSANRVWGSYTSGGAAYTNYKGRNTDWHRYDNFMGVENIIGSKNADAITGNSGINMLDGGAGNDRLYGLAGADILLGGLGNDLLDGGSDVDSMTGGLGDDTYTVDNVNDSVVEDLNQGVDLVNSSVSYTLKDNVENLSLIGNLSINGFGNAQNNVIKGNSASNTIDGGSGSDTIYGDLGDDLFIGHTGVSTFFDGGDGSDTVDYSNSSVGISTKLTADVINWGLSSSGGGAFKVYDGGADSAEKDDFVGIENIIGSSFDDIIVGNDGSNIFAGGLGSDYLTGASGSDVFIFNSSLGTDNIDVISDFNYSEGDRIYLDQKIFTKLAGVTDLSNYFVDNGRMNSNSFLLYSPETGHLSYDSDGTGSANLQEFLIFSSGQTEITASCFVVI